MKDREDNQNDEGEEEEELNLDDDEQRLDPTDIVGVQYGPKLVESDGEQEVSFNIERDINID